MLQAVTIPARFNGPPSSANGGYACGLVAGLVGTEEVTVSLRLPPPVETPVRVVRDGARVELRDDDALVAEGAPAELLLDVPDAISPDEAAAASQKGRDHWCSAHPFPTCFACGPDRAPGDGLRIFPGELRDGLFAADWTPHESLDDGSGHVRPECLWAALDCPTSAPVANFATGPPMVLARLTARVGCSVNVGERHAIVAWPLAADGRKRHAACALFDSAGGLLCASEALWIELRQE
ncbi:MAG: hypothetical protein H0T69_11575 [Thermoleophilaceae bacterium]|nr:hypothetical protein [Thermoleophilaceae bacterium]